MRSFLRLLLAAPDFFFLPPLPSLSADSTHTVLGQVSVKQEASVLGYNLLPRSRIRSRSLYLGINTFSRGSSDAPRGGGSGGGLSLTIWSQGSLWVRYGARRLNLVTGLTSSRGNAGGMRDPSTAHPSASSPRLSSLMLTVPRSQLLSAAQRQRFSCLSSHIGKGPEPFFQRRARKQQQRKREGAARETQGSLGAELEPRPGGEGVGGKRGGYCRGGGGLWQAALRRLPSGRSQAK